MKRAHTGGALSEPPGNPSGFLNRGDFARRNPLITCSHPRPGTNRDTSNYRIARAWQHIEDSRAQLLRVSVKNLRKTADALTQTNKRISISLMMSVEGCCPTGTGGQRAFSGRTRSGGSTSCCVRSGPHGSGSGNGSPHTRQTCPVCGGNSVDSQTGGYHCRAVCQCDRCQCGAARGARAKPGDRIDVRVGKVSAAIMATTGQQSQLWRPRHSTRRQEVPPWKHSRSSWSPQRSAVSC